MVVVEKKGKSGKGEEKKRLKFVLRDCISSGGGGLDENEG